MSRVRTIPLVLAMSALLLAGGCGGGGDESTTTSAAEGSATTVADTGPTVEGTGSGEPVSMCPRFTKADAEALFGAPLAEGPTELPANSSQLGGCEYYTATGLGLVTGARPVEEYEPTAEAAENPEPVPGLGDDAVWGTNQGLVVKLHDQRWFLTVQGFREAVLDKDLALRTAEKIVSAA